MIFESIKEGIIELMEDLLRALWRDMASSQSGTNTLSFKDFKGCCVLDFQGVKDLILARSWIADIKST